MLWVKVKLFEILKNHSVFLSKELRNDEHLAACIETVVNSQSAKAGLWRHSPPPDDPKFEFADLTGAYTVIHFQRFWHNYAKIISMVMQKANSDACPAHFILNEEKFIFLLTTALVVASKYAEDLAVWNSDFVKYIAVRKTVYFIDVKTLRAMELFYLSVHQFLLHINHQELLSLILQEADYIDGVFSPIQKHHLQTRVRFFNHDSVSIHTQPKSLDSLRIKQDLITSKATLFEPRKTPMKVSISYNINAIVEKRYPN